jgi:rhodanese-related sulfurtransferase/DNA-binding transcriptional ArsR family regulator
MTTPGRKYKDAIYEQFGIIGKSVASPRRLELLDLLCQGPRTVEELAREASQSVANTSQHLQVLRASRLVETEKKGLYVTYRLADELVCEFFRTLRVLAESRLAEIERVTREFLEQRGVMEPVDQNALQERVKKGESTVIDVRPVEEYQAGHIPGSISVPLEKLEQRLADLPRDKEIVAYCRGPYCVLAIKAVELLQAKGFKAVRLEDGVPDWRAHGFKVAVGDESQ